MKKNLIAILAAGCMCLALTACGGDTPDSQSEGAESESSSPVSSEISSQPEESSAPVSVSASVSVSEAEEEEPEQEEPAPAAGDADLGDTLESAIKVSLDGEVYTFPGAAFADFEANGWAIDPGAAGATLPANTTTRIEYTKGESAIDMSSANEGDEVAPIEEGTCWALVIDSYDIKDMDVVLPGGITLGSSPEEVEAAYGAPADFYDNDEGERLSMEYQMDDSKVKFQFFEGALSGIDIRC